MQTSLTPMKNQKQNKNIREDKKRDKTGYNRQEVREAKRQS